MPVYLAAVPECCSETLENSTTTADKVHVINLKAGVELQTSPTWNVTATNIVNNILRFKGKYNRREDVDRLEKGYLIEFELSQYNYEI